LAGLFGGLAAATRILGVLLAYRLCLGVSAKTPFPAVSFRLDVLGGFLIPAGLGGYMLYLYGLTGDPMALSRRRPAGIAAWWPLGGAGHQPERRCEGGIYPYFQAHALIENGLVLACIGVLVLAGAAPDSGLVRALWRRLPGDAAQCPGGYQLHPDHLDVPLRAVLAPVLHRAGPFRRWAIFDRLYVLLSVGGLAIFTTLFLNHMWAPEQLP